MSGHSTRRAEIEAAPAAGCMSAAEPRRRGRKPREGGPGAPAARLFALPAQLWSLARKPWSLVTEAFCLARKARNLVRKAFCLARKALEPRAQGFLLCAQSSGALVRKAFCLAGGASGFAHEAFPARPPSSSPPRPACRASRAGRAYPRPPWQGEAPPTSPGEARRGLTRISHRWYGRRPLGVERDRSQTRSAEEYTIVFEQGGIALAQRFDAAFEPAQARNGELTPAVVSQKLGKHLPDTAVPRVYPLDEVNDGTGIQEDRHSSPQAARSSRSEASMLSRDRAPSHGRFRTRSHMSLPWAGAVEPCC